MAGQTYAEIQKKSELRTKALVANSEEVPQRSSLTRVGLDSTLVELRLTGVRLMTDSEESTWR